MIDSPGRRGRAALQWFAEYAARPPSRLRQGLALLVAALVVATSWRESGPIGGVVAMGVALIVVASAFAHAEFSAWSNRHRLLDALLLAPMLFLLLFSVFHASLVPAVLISAAGAALLMAVVRYRSRERA